MIEWKRIEAGEYTSKDGRFHILKTWDRVYGNHWQLRDAYENNYYKGLYYESSLLDCKLKAEAVTETKSEV